MLSKNDILEAKDIETEVVSVPEWGGDVIVQGLTLAEKDEWDKSLLVGDKVSTLGATAALCALSMFDEKGNQLFSVDDILELQKKSAKALDRVFQVAQKLSGIGNKAIEETAKNSGKTQTPDSD